MIVKTEAMQGGKSPPIPDRKAFILSALDEYEQPLTRYAMRMLGSKSNFETAKDAVQHTFLKLCEQDLDSLSHKVGPWLYRVCRNRIIDLLRSKGRNTESWPESFQVCDSTPGPAEKAEQADFYRRLSVLIGTLSGMEREVIELWSQGFPHSEIANILKKSNESVRVGLYRGMKKLRQHPEVTEWLERATGQSKQEISHGQSNANLAPKRRTRKQSKPR